VDTTIPSERNSSGSCLCGGVRYELRGEPLKSVVCHCLECRKASGSSFMANSMYKSSQLKIIAGEPNLKTYDDRKAASSATRHRQFCSVCGSPLFTTNPNLENVVIVTSGSLDDGWKEWRPQAEIYCMRRAEWLPKVEGMAMLEKMQ